MFSILALVPAAFASQSLRLTPSTAVTFRTPEKPPYSDLTSFEIEIRLHDWSPLRDMESSNLVSLPSGFQLRVMGNKYNAPLAITDWADTYSKGQGNTIFLNPGKLKDFILRIQRNARDRTLSGEMWSADGTSYVKATLPIDQVNDTNFSGEGSIGGSRTQCDLAFLRWSSGTVPLGRSPFEKHEGDLADWEFEGNLASEQPLKVHMDSGSPPEFVKSPGYPPFASQGPTRTLDAEAPSQLNGSDSHSLSDNQPVLFKWEQVSGPTTLHWDSTKIARPTVTGLTFGSYRVRLIVTDSQGASSSNITKYGAVTTDFHGVIQPPEPFVNLLFGQMLRIGAGPWHYADEANVRLGDFFGTLQTTDFLPVWTQGLAGTISMHDGSNIITGDQTSFRSSFCGGSNRSDGSSIIIWYPVPGSNRHFGRRSYGVASCESDTSLKLTRPYITSESAEHVHYSRMTEGQSGAWINGSTNANYYDNVMAFYALYYRTGIDDYQRYARTLADRWWTQPWLDEGRSCSDGDGTTCMFPRLQSVVGLIARALDGRPDMWPGLRSLIQADAGLVNWTPGNRNVVDVRERAYATAFIALAALLDPDTVQRSKWKMETQKSVEQFWAPARFPAGNWENQSFGAASWNGQPGSASVTHGSKEVTGSGTKWQPQMFPGMAFWTSDNDAVSHGDAISYTATYVSPTELTLNIPYQGPTASGRGWEAASLVGMGTQPFMLGVLGSTFRFAYLATHDERLAQWISGIANWLQTKGFRPSTRGLWYGRDFPNCEPISETNPWCSGGNAEASRFLSGEVLGAIAAAYSLAPSPGLKKFGDDLYSAIFAKYEHDPGYDGTYVNDFDGPTSWDFQVKKSKDFGFFFGFGRAASWPAARIEPEANGKAANP